MVFHCGFDLPFPDDQLSWPCFLVLMDHLFIFFGQMSLWILCPFLIGLSFYYWVVRVLYIYWIQDPDIYIVWKYIFSSVDYLFTFLMVPFEALMFLILMKSNRPVFYHLYFSVISNKSLPNPRPQRYIPVFFFNILIVLTLTFRSVILFVLILGVVWGRGAKAFICMWISYCVCCKNYYFLPLNCLASLSKIN